MGGARGGSCRVVRGRRAHQRPRRHDRPASPRPRSPRPTARAPRRTRWRRRPRPPPCGAPSTLAASAGVPVGPEPAGRLRPPRRGRAHVVGEGFHRGAGTPHAEVAALPRRAPRPAAATAVVTLEPCNHTGRTGPVRRGADRGRRRPGRVRPGRPQPGRGRRRAGAARRRASTSRAGCSPTEARGAQPGLDLRRRARPPVRHLEVRRAPSTAGRRRRRHQPVDHRRRWPARDVHAPARDGRRDRRRDRHRRSPTTRSSPSATARRPACRDRQPLRVVVGARDRSRRTARVLDGAAPTLRARHPRPRRGARRRCSPADVRHVLLEGGPTLAGAFVARRPGRPRSSPTSPRSCSAPGPPRWGPRASRRSPRRCACDRSDVTRLGDDVRITAPVAASGREG